MSYCPVNRTVYGNLCDGPGTYYCNSDLWGSACRRHFQVHRYDPETQRCICGALDHPDVDAGR